MTDTLARSLIHPFRLLVGGLVTLCGVSLVAQQEPTFRARTETVSIYAYKTLMRAGDFGYGSSLAIAIFLAALGISLVYVRVLGRVLGAAR